MYYLITFAYIIIGLTILPIILPKDFSLFGGVTALTFTNGWFPSTVNSFAPGAWSIGAEMTFYMLFPFLLRLKGKKWLAAATTAASFALSLVTCKIIMVSMPETPGYAAHFAYFFWIVQLPAFVSGVCIAVWLPYLQRYANIAKFVLPLSIVLIAGAALSRGLTSSYIAADVLFSVMVISGALYQSLFLRSRLMQYIGTISFSIYLNHFLFVRLLETLAPKYNRFGLFSNDTVAVVGFFLILAVSILVSSITYSKVELNGKSLGDALLRRNRATREGRAMVT